MQAQSSISVPVDPLAALRAPGALRETLRKRALPLAGAAALAAAVAVLAPQVAQKFADALARALHADPRWVAAAIVLELLSIGGYIALFRHVAGAANPRFGFRASAEVTLAGAAVTRLLPTAGAGGAALTFWSLRRAGQSSREATGTLLTFLVVLYAVFLGALAVSGTLLATGAAHSDVPRELAALPAAGALLAMAIALVLAVRHALRAAAAVDVADQPEGRLRSAAGALGAAMHGALAVVRRPHARLLGAPAWWGFDMLVLWATLSAFGEPPSPAVMVLGYFLGQVANTVPLPGAASGGMAAAFIALGSPAAVVLPAVLAYRAIAIWTPVPAGAVAIAGLRSTVRRWAAEEGETVGAEVETTAGDAEASPSPHRRESPLAPRTRGQHLRTPSRSDRPRPRLRAGPSLSVQAAAALPGRAEVIEPAEAGIGPHVALAGRVLPA